ncbi:MAG: 4'-phosphopantetheinyl transferase superfamily protein [Deltaproteobacteria bacterium]|nr:4'-phosphopantetheinyl transferase superfamily protein [Deltaproteobacteria bacterium]
MPRSAAHLQPVYARDPGLPPGISMWLCDLAALPWNLDQCRALLPPEPAPTPAPLRPIAHLRRLQTRALLHLLLAEQLGVAPQQLTPTLGPNGKPELPGLAFNSSHSGDWALLGLGPVPALGVDLEVQRPRRQLSDLTSYCLCDREVLLWNSIPNEEQLLTFYCIWTAKEAALKAWGRGIDQLQQVALDHLLRPAQARLSGHTPCRIHSLVLPGPLVGALALA